MKYVLLFLGVLAGCPLIWRQRELLGLKRFRQALLLCLGFSAGSTLSAMLFASMEDLLSGNRIQFGAISTYGVYFFCPLAVYVAVRAAKRNRWRWMDAFALYVVPSFFLMRINCLYSGCCSGRTIGTTRFHWPTRQAEMVFYAVMLLVLLHREKVGAPDGTAFPLLMAAYGAFRYVEEWFRKVPGDNLLHIAHGWSVAAFVIGLGLYFELSGGQSEKRRPYKERRNPKC